MNTNYHPKLLLLGDNNLSPYLDRSSSSFIRHSHEVYAYDPHAYNVISWCEYLKHLDTNPIQHSRRDELPVPHETFDTAISKYQPGDEVADNDLCELHRVLKTGSSLTLIAPDVDENRVQRAGFDITALSVRNQTVLLKAVKSERLCGLNRQPVIRNTLVIWSGGLDSSYALWNRLRETNDRIFAFHLDMKNFEGRVDLERESCETIRKYLEDNVRSFEFYSMSMEVPSKTWIGYDWSHAVYTASQAIIHFSLTHDIFMDYYTAGIAVDEPFWSGRYVASRRMMPHALWPLECPTYFEYDDISKQDMVDQMPREITANVWGCRRPKDNKPCGSCAWCSLIRDGVVGTVGPQ